MKVYLVTPDERKNLSCAGDRPPLGVLSLATILKNNKIDVTVYDQNHGDLERLEKDYENSPPDFIGYSFTSSPTYNDMRKLMKKLGKRNIHVKTIVGGYHVTVRPQDFKDADYIVRGDGLEAILNIAKGGKVSEGINPISADKIKFPVRTFLNPSNYNLIQNGKRTATLMTGNGCVYDCLFCGNYQHSIKLRDVKNIDSELQHLSMLGYRALYLLDDTFTINKKHMKDTSDLILNYGFPYRCTTRSNLIDDSVAKQLSKTGCEIVSLGIESANDKTLDLVSKKTKVETHENAIRLLGNTGIDVKGFFIIGLPGETESDIKRTIDWACRMKQEGLKSADFYALTPFPGSRLYDSPEKYGIKILETDWSKYLQAGKELIEPVIETEYLSREKIKELLRDAKNEFTRI